MGWHTAANGRPGPSSQEGFTMLEVVVAVVVLLVALVPNAYLLSSADSLLTANRSKTVAVNLASSQLEEDRSVADAETWSTGPFAPSLPAPTASQTVGDTVYAMTQSAGWCAETGGTWGDFLHAPAQPAGYGILVKVSWEAGSVSAGTVLMTPVGQSSDVPTSSSACPL